MTTTAKDTGGGDYTPAPEGTHVARCVQVIDIGTQYSEYYKKSSHKILLGWELPNEKQENGEPYLIWHRYTLSLGPKAALRNHLESWRGRKFTEEELAGFDLVNVLGVPCMLSIVHSESGGNTYANVSSVMAIVKGLQVPDQINDGICFDIDKWDDKLFETFSEHLKKTIENSAERKASRGEVDQYSEPVGDADEQQPEQDEDIPF